MSQSWLIYGAYGYSAQLIAQEAKRRGLTPILAGRDEAKVKTVATRLKFDYRVFDLSDPQAVAEQLADIALVIHCAGPFSHTSKPMIEACIRSSTHYFDITGEIDVFEYAHSDVVNGRAKAAGIVVCPGVGFDVIPTDCVARVLSEAMPDATHLTLGFSGGSALSPGTAKSSVEGLANGNKVRSNGEIVSSGVNTRTIDFGKGPRNAMNIAWGDVSTAFYSTGIPNIEVYIPASSKTIRMVKLAGLLKPALRLSFVQDFLKKQIDKKVAGPGEEVRRKYRSSVWGEVRNSLGEVKTAYLETPNGYDVTVLGPLAIVEHFLAGNNSVTGSVTPSLLMGADFVSTLPDTTKIRIQ
ncbi:saccharopine dehydrogenase family protein [Alkalimarinus sediminis]|uniref:Saccharopine dehydrogenase NADP-binding domain-containing protein n=1 Tax=Alkalimarinus sediminis TaxID=1632866 RepID=A0A9E8HTR4_9ALTE|nr:saccharopine dehydrogenase NADP-binding domain-containing protein [Alkalimarinus sediminis]UZW75584.1 saccharopine dehydrogenase NADP-binding domain-containing protein [Alkalimarinus sediminis]